MENNEYKVAKKEKPVSILLDSQPPFREEVVLFLNPHSRFGTGPEAVDEFLNHAPPFIPVRFRRTGVYSLINVKEIIWVRELESPHSRLSHITVRLFLAGDVAEDLDQAQILPPSRSRLLDYLNGPEKFIAFRRDDKNIFINKNKIIRSEENG